MPKKGEPIKWTKEYVEKKTQEALTVIKEKKLHFKEDVWAEIGTNRGLAKIYKLTENKEIIEALNENRINVKRNLRTKWYISDNATLQITLYKLLADKEELSRIAYNRTEMTGKDGKDLVSGVIILPEKKDENSVAATPKTDGSVDKK